MKFNKKSMTKLGIVLLILIIPLIIWGIGGVNSYGVDGAYNVTINNTQVYTLNNTNKSAYMCSGIYNNNASLIGNISICWLNNSITYDCSNRLNAGTGTKINHSIRWKPNGNDMYLSWRFSEGNGLYTTDVNGSVVMKMAGTGSNIFWNNTFGVDNYYLRFTDASNSYLVNNSVMPYITSTSGLSFGAWVNTTGMSRYNGQIISQGSKYGMYMTSNISQFFCCIYNASLSSKCYQSTANWGALNNSWNRVVCTWNGSRINFYSNGVLWNSQDYDTAVFFAGGMNSNDSNFYIGSQSSTGNFLNGSVDEAFVINRTLTVTEVALDYNQSEFLGNNNWNCTINATDSNSEPSLLTSKQVIFLTSTAFIQPNVAYTDSGIWGFCPNFNTNNTGSVELLSNYYFKKNGVIAKSGNIPLTFIAKFEGDTTSNIENASIAKGYNFTPSGKFGQGIDLNGGTLTYQLDNNSINYTQGAISFWFKPHFYGNGSDYPSTTCGIFSIDTGNQSSPINLRRVGYTFYYNASGSNIQNNFGNFDKDKWHQITLTWDKWYLTYIMDGIQLQTNSLTSSTTGLIKNPTNITFGKVGSGDLVCNFSIDELKIYYDDAPISREFAYFNFLRDNQSNTDEAFYNSSELAVGDNVIFGCQVCDNTSLCSDYTESSTITIQRQKSNSILSFATADKVIDKFIFGVQNEINKSRLADINIVNRIKELNSQIYRYWIIDYDIKTSPLLNASSNTACGSYNYTNLTKAIREMYLANQTIMLAFGSLPSCMKTRDQYDGNTFSMPYSIENWSNYVSNVTKWFYDVCSNGTGLYYAGNSIPCNTSDWYIEPTSNEPSKTIWFGIDTNLTKYYNATVNKIRSYDKYIKLTAPVSGWVPVPINSPLTDAGTYYYGFTDFLANSSEVNYINLHMYSFNPYSLSSGYLDGIHLSLLNLTQIEYYTTLSSLTDLINTYKPNAKIINGEWNIHSAVPMGQENLNRQGVQIISATLWQMKAGVYSAIFFQEAGTSPKSSLSLFNSSGSYEIYSPTFYMLKTFNHVYQDNMSLYNAQDSDALLETWGLKRNNSAKVIIEINKHNATIDTNISIGQSEGLVWDLQGYKYVDSVNRTGLTAYNISFVAPNSDKFNLTEGQPTGLLDTNGNEITDDVDNKVWITSSSTNSIKHIGNNLSSIINASLTGNVSHCNINSTHYQSNTSTYKANYTSGWTCSSNKIRQNLSNLEKSANSNEWWIVYNLPSITISSPSGQNTSGVGTTNLNIPMTFNVSEGVTKCNYSINYSAPAGITGVETQNTSITGCANFTHALSIPNTQLDSINYFSVYFSLIDNNGNQSTTHRSFSVKIVSQAQQGGGGGGGGGGTQDNSIDSYICNKTYNYILKNGQTSAYLNNLLAEMKSEKGTDYSFTTLETYITNWQGLCSESLGKSLEPKFVCEKIYYFIVNNNWNYTNAEFEGLKATISEKVAISSKLLGFYLSNYNTLCVRLGYTASLPNNPYSTELNPSVIKNFFDFEPCNVKTGVGFFDWNIPFMKVNLGSELSCTTIDNLRFWIALTIENDGNYYWMGIKVWEIIVAFGVIVILWIRSIVKKVSKMD